MWNDRTYANDKYDPWCNTCKQREKDRKTNKVIKKPYAIVQYNKFIKDIERANQNLIYYTVLKKTVKWLKKGGTISAKLCAFQSIFCVQETKYKRNKVQEILSWGRKFLDIRSPESKWVNFRWPSIAREGSPKQDLLGRHSGDFRIHKFEKIVGDGEGKRKYPARQCKVCAAHKKWSETRNICKFCVVPLQNESCFEKYHSVMNY